MQLAGRSLASGDIVGVSALFERLLERRGGKCAGDFRVSTQVPVLPLLAGFFFRSRVGLWVLRLAWDSRVGRGGRWLVVMEVFVYTVRVAVGCMEWLNTF